MAHLPGYLMGLCALAVLSALLFVTLSSWKNHTFSLQEDFSWQHEHSDGEYTDLLLNNNGNMTSKRKRVILKGTGRRKPVNRRDRYYLNPEIISAQYSILPKPCSAFIKKTFLVIIAFSRPEGFKLRQAIRKTWGSLADSVCGVRMLFMFGRVYDDNVQTMLNQEAEKYGDVIQSNQFDDKYRAAAHKAIHLLQWGATFCPDSVYTAKVDDDNWVNLPKYVNFLKENQHKDYVYGAMFGAGTRVIRDPNSKYYVPLEEFEPELYPEYLSGVLYAFPTRFLPRVVYVAKSMQVTFNDDVYVCGIVTTASNLTRKEVPDYAWDHNIHDTLCPKRDKMCIHYSKIEDFYRLWNDPCYRYEELC